MVDLIEVEDDESKSWKKKEPGPLKDIVDAGGKPAGGIQSEGEPASLEHVIPSNGEPASLEDEMILLWPTGDDWCAAAELADKLNSQLGVAIDMVLLAGWVAVARVATESSQCMDATSCIGNRIHYIVSTLNSVWAGKITGMFLENDIQDLQEMLCVSDNSKAAALFVERVWQALGVLAQAFSLESPCYQDDETPASAKTFPEETASAVSALQPPAASPAPLYAHTICIRPLDRARHTWTWVLPGHGSPTCGTHIDPVASRTRAGHRRVDDPLPAPQDRAQGRAQPGRLLQEHHSDGPTDGPQRRHQKCPGSHAGGDRRRAAAVERGVSGGDARPGGERLAFCAVRLPTHSSTHPAFIAQGDADWTVSAKEFPGVKPATAPIGSYAAVHAQSLNY